jgi:hypothetical protein
MEPSELVANDNEHAKGLPRVLDLGQEIGSQPEGQCNLGWLIEIGFEDMLIENQEALQDLEILLVGHGTADFVVKLFIGQRLDELQTLIRQSRPEKRGTRQQILTANKINSHEVVGLIRGRVMCHGEVDIE